MKNVLGCVSVGVMVAVAVCVSGCASGGAAKEKGGVTCRVVAKEKILNNNLTVLESNVKKAGDLLAVEAKAQNTSKSDQSFEYRFVWLEKGGVVADAPIGNWEPASVRVNETVVMKGQAPTAKVVDFLLSLRAGR